MVTGLTIRNFIENSMKYDLAETRYNVKMSGFKFEIMLLTIRSISILTSELKERLSNRVNINYTYKLKNLLSINSIPNLKLQSRIIELDKLSDVLFDQKEYINVHIAREMFIDQNIDFLDDKAESKLLNSFNCAVELFGEPYVDEYNTIQFDYYKFDNIEREIAHMKGKGYIEF